MVLTQLCKRCVRLRLERDWEDTADLILAYSGCPLIDECQDNKQKHRKKKKKRNIQYMKIIGIAVLDLHTGFPPGV